MHPIPSSHNFRYVQEKPADDSITGRAMQKLTNWVLCGVCARGGSKQRSNTNASASNVASNVGGYVDVVDDTVTNTMGGAVGAVGGVLKGVDRLVLGKRDDNKQVVHDRTPRHLNAKALEQWHHRHIHREEREMSAEQSEARQGVVSGHHWKHEKDADIDGRGHTENVVATPAGQFLTSPSWAMRLSKSKETSEDLLSQSAAEEQLQKTADHYKQESIRLNAKLQAHLLSMDQMLSDIEGQYMLREQGDPAALDDEAMDGMVKDYTQQEKRAQELVASQRSYDHALEQMTDSVADEVFIKIKSPPKQVANGIKRSPHDIEL